MGYRSNSYDPLSRSGVKHSASRASIYSEVDDSQWEVPKSHFRSFDRRNQEPISGTESADNVKGAIRNTSEIFVSRVQQSTSDDAMINWIEHTGVTILNFERRSHEDSKLKLFKVTLSPADYMYLYKPSLWPKGVRLKKLGISQNLELIILIMGQQSLEDNLYICTYNIHGYNSTKPNYVLELMNKYSILIIEEHWLNEKQLGNFTELFAGYCVYGVTAMDSTEVLQGQPHGGVVVIYPDSIGSTANNIKADAKRLCATSLEIHCISLYLFCVYMHS